MPLSGKTATAEYLEKKGYTVLDMGSIVRIEMEKRNIGPDNTGKFVNSMRDEHGMDAIARMCVPYLEEMLESENKIVITGMRSLEEKERFEEETDEKLEMIALWSPTATRKKRREKRQRPEDTEGQKFEERDQRELKNGVGELMALSDHLIKNEGTIEELEKRLDNIVNT